MQDFLTKQGEPKPNTFLIISPLFVTAYPSTHMALSVKDLPYSRGPDVISDCFLFLFPHIPDMYL